MTPPARGSQSPALGRAPRPDRPLRILLAHDLSPRADLAAALVGTVRWPPGTTVRVVTSPVGLTMGTSSFASVREVRSYQRQLRRSIAVAHRRVAAELVTNGMTVQTDVAHASPADAVIEDARRFEADLIVVGAREQGPIAATLLGSVSAQIMDRAECSVLVSRGPPVERVLLATDGSTPARVAVDIVANWLLFAGAQIRVLGIGSPPPKYAGQVLSPVEMSAVQDDWANATKTTIEDVVGEAVEQLTASRRDVQGKVRIGDPHSQIVAAARAWRTDLVVIGATGQSPLRSILLGSVARRILHRATASVLIARAPSREGSGSVSDRH